MNDRIPIILLRRALSAVVAQHILPSAIGSVTLESASCPQEWLKVLLAPGLDFVVVIGQDPSNLLLQTIKHVSRLGNPVSVLGICKALSVPLVDALSFEDEVASPAVVTCGDVSRVFHHLTHRFFSPDAIAIEDRAVSELKMHEITQCCSTLRGGGSIAVLRDNDGGRQGSDKIIQEVQSREWSIDDRQTVTILTKPLSKASGTLLKKYSATQRASIESSIIKEYVHRQSFPPATRVSAPSENFTYVESAVGGWDTIAIGRIVSIRRPTTFWPAGAAVTLDGELILETLQSVLMHHGDVPELKCDRDTEWRPTAIKGWTPTYVPGRTWYVHNVYAGNYWHFFVDVVSKLWALDRARRAGLIPMPDRVVVSKHSLAGFGLKFFNLFPEYRDILFVPSTNCIVFDELLLPALMTIESEGHRASMNCTRRHAIFPDYFEWINRFVVAPARRLTNVEPNRRKLFISRSDTNKRIVSNEQQIASSLSERGFTTVVPSKIPFYEQVAMSSTAEAIVGMHGAGLANCIFSPPDLQLVEFRPPGLDDISHKYLSQAKAQNYSVVLANEIGDLSRSPNDRDAEVDPNLLRAHLDALGLW